MKGTTTVVSDFRSVDHQLWKATETDPSNTMIESSVKLLHQHLHLLYKPPKLCDSAELRHQLLIQYFAAVNNSHLFQHQLHDNIDQVTNLCCHRDSI